MCVSLWRSEEGVRFPRVGVTDSCKLPDMGDGLKSGPLEEPYP